MNRPLAVLRDLWERAAIYLPIILMGVLALGTYWLVRNTPIFGAPEPAPPVLHKPDYFMHNFAVKTFDATGRLKNEVFGTEGRHYPDTDTLEIARNRTVESDQIAASRYGQLLPLLVGEVVPDIAAGSTDDRVILDFEQNNP